MILIENKKFLYGLVREGARAREYEDALLWLLDSGLLHRVGRITKAALPMKAHEDLKSFKIYHLDVGLLRVMSELSSEVILDSTRLFEEFKGALTEQFVLQELSSLPNIRSIYYWTSESIAEVDFVISDGTRVIPIEVKASSVRNKLFREVVGNILIHREYSNAFPAKLIIGSDKVTTENGNKAHGNGIIDINDFIPFPKNPAIAGVFKEIGWADELGSGIRNIKHYAEIYSNSVPVFIEGDVFKTIVKLKTDDKKPIKADRKPIKADRKQEIILSYLNENEYITNKIARELLGLAESTTKRFLNEMVDNNMLTIEGEYKNRIYKPKE